MNVLTIADCHGKLLLSDLNRHRGLAELLTKDKEEDFWMTKKQMKAENKKRRNFWTINPTTRIKESKKIYSRKNKKIEY